MSKPNPSEQIIADNKYGLIFMGPSGQIDELGESLDTNMVVSLKGGQNQTYTLGGNKGEIVPGQSHEIVGTELDKGRNDSESEAIAKSIIAENGDIVINAENGNIKLKAKNIYIEAQGEESNGSILVKANDHIIIRAEEQINVAGGKVCISSADSITLNANGFLNVFYSDIKQSSPFNVNLKAFTIDTALKLIDDIVNSCK
tara:strand:+ start:105 stop:707 length:603 start_codon:yes stop_codon:yes gene_type:complete